MKLPQPPISLEDFNSIPPIPSLPSRLRTPSHTYGSGRRRFARDGTIHASDQSLIAALKEEDINYLSQEEREELIRNGWEIKETERRLDYRPDWSIWMGFREFVQNALDETAKVDFEYDSETGISYIVDEGGGFTPISLLLGKVKALTQEDRYCLRGYFGEGMKIAIHPFLREGKRVFIRTAGFDMTFTVSWYTIKGESAPIINSLIRDNNITQGTAVGIEDFDCTKYQDRFTLSLPPEEIILSIRDSWYKCQVRQVLDRPGDIYLRDIFVENVPGGIFGYNFWFGESTSKIVGPDRNKLIASNKLLLQEYMKFIPAEGFLVALFSRIKDIVDNGAVLAIGLFEYGILGESPLTISLDSFNQPYDIYDIESDIKQQGSELNTAMILIDRAIREVFLSVSTDKNKNYSWGTTYEEARALEHLNVYNLHRYLPNMSVTLNFAGFCRLVKDWISVDDVDVTEEVTVESMQEMLNKSIKEYYFIDGKFTDGLEIDYEQSMQETTESVSAYKKLLALINRYSQGIAGYSAHIFIKPNLVESTIVEAIGGFCRKSDKTAWVRFDALFEADKFIEVLNHELAHALCYNNSSDKQTCKDLTDRFEKYLVRVGIIMARRWPNFYDEVEVLIQQLNEPITGSDRYSAVQIIHYHEQDIVEKIYNLEAEGVDKITRAQLKETKTAASAWYNMYELKPHYSYIKHPEYVGSEIGSFARYDEDIINLVDPPEASFWEAKLKKRYRYRKSELPPIPRSVRDVARYAVIDMINPLADLSSFIFDRSIPPDEFNVDILAQGLLDLGLAKFEISNDAVVIVDFDKMIRGEDFTPSVTFLSGESKWKDEVLARRYLAVTSVAHSDLL